MDHGGWRLVAVGVAVAAALAGCDVQRDPVRATATSSAPTPTVTQTQDVQQSPVERAKADINEQLSKQSAALLKGDRRGYVATAANKTVGAQLDQRFDALRGLKVAELRQEVAGAPERSGDDAFVVTIYTEICFVVKDCVTGTIPIETRWRQTADGLRLDNLRSTDEPRPWETDRLVSVAGKRVIVATTPDRARDARAVLPAAESAAKVADSFSVGGYKPYRYVVFLASTKQWQRWYGGHGAYYIGFAMTGLPEATDLVVRQDKLSGELLRHEMIHLSTLGAAPAYDADNDAWWLSEGIADLGSGDSYRDSVSRQQARQFMTRTRYKGDLQSVSPSGGDSDDTLDAKYALGWFATTCIDEKYGRKKLDALVDALLRHNTQAAQAAPAVLGTDWAKVESTCFAYTRRAVGL